MAAVWAGRFEEGERHLDRALVEARRIGRPRLELLALARPAGRRDLSCSRGGGGGRPGRRSSWREARLGGGRCSRRRLYRARRGGVLARAASTRRSVVECERTSLLAMPSRHRAVAVCRSPGTGVRARPARAGDDRLRAAERMEMPLVMPHIVGAACASRPAESVWCRRARPTGWSAPWTRWMSDVRATPEMRVVRAELRLAQDDPLGAAAAVAPIVDGTLAVPDRVWRFRRCFSRRQPATRCAIPVRVPGAGARARARRARRTAGFPSCCTRRRSCSSATRDFGPLTPR